MEKTQKKQVAGVAVVCLAHTWIPARTAFPARVDVRDAAVEDLSTSALVHFVEFSVASWLAACECGAVELPNRTGRGLTMFDRILLPDGTSGHPCIIRNRGTRIRIGSGAA